MQLCQFGSLPTLSEYDDFVTTLGLINGKLLRR